MLTLERSTQGGFAHRVAKTRRVVRGDQSHVAELRFARATQRKLRREIAGHAPKPMSPAKESPLPIEAKA